MSINMKMALKLQIFSNGFTDPQGFEEDMLSASALWNNY